jgi:serine protease Do
MIAFAGPARLGVTVQELTDQLAGYFGAGDGVLVTTVGDDSAARTAGLRAGDVITRVDGEAVTNGAELRRRLTDAEGTATLTIVRDRKEQTITVTLPDGGTPKPTISR